MSVNAMTVSNNMKQEHPLEREGLSVAEACAIAGIGRTKLYEIITAGDLVARKLGRRRIILRQDLLRFLETLPSA
jgi:excisionase family DNA binding protein